MDISHFTLQQWLLATLAALMVGLAKSGFSGVGMLILVLMALVMPGHEMESTGVVLPLLVCGDVFASRAFYRHVQWPMLFRMLPPAMIGVVIGFFWMKHMSNTGFKPLIGCIVLGLTILHVIRQNLPGRLQNVPHSLWFIWSMGIAAGITTMIANAAGPIVTLFVLAVALPKLEFVGTGDLFFLTINLFKIPFSAKLNFITLSSLGINLALVPFVFLGILGGRFLLHRMNQHLFEKVLLALTALTALHLIFY